LMDRIRQDGQLVSYVHPVESNRSGTAVAAGGSRIPARFVSQGEDGPALMPAGPQNNVYSNPPENRAPARAPQYTPPPYTPPPTAYTPPSYTPAPGAPATLPAPPAAPTTVPSYPRSGMPNLLRRPAVPPAEAQSPASRAPVARSPVPQSPVPQSTGPQSKRLSNPPAKSNSRWQYPPQYRRQAGQSPGSLAPNAAGSAPSTGPGTAPQGTAPQGTAPQGTAPQGTAPQGTAPQGTAPQGTARSTPQQRQQRLPWRRPGATDAQQQTPPLPSANAAKPQAVPRSRLQRNPAATGGQQPPAAGRLQPRYQPPPGYQPPARYPSTPYGSAQTGPSSSSPQPTTPSSDGYPPGIPQPPQLSSRPATTY
jgi:hypothetical protein